MKRALLILALVLSAALAVAPQAAGLSVALAGEQPAAPPAPDTCAAEGGCIWVSRKDLSEAFLAAAQLGYEKGVDAGKHDAELVCRNNVVYVPS